MLAELATEIDAARLLVHRAAWLVELSPTRQLASFLFSVVRAPANVIVAAGTSTNKTTTLRCLVNATGGSGRHFFSRLNHGSSEAWSVRWRVPDRQIRYRADLVPDLLEEMLGPDPVTGISTGSSTTFRAPTKRSTGG